MRKMLCTTGHWSLTGRGRFTQICWNRCLAVFLWSSFITTTLPRVSHRGVTDSAQTCSTASECLSITWSAPCRCFQFVSRCRARSQKCTSVLLLPGCCSQNTSDSRADVVTGVYKPMSPKAVCNHVSGRRNGAHVLAFMHDALHDKLRETGIMILCRPRL